MKKILILSLILVVAAASAFATGTRVLTMGDNNNVMIDDANVSLYPSRVFNYPNIGVGEFGSTYDGEGYYGNMYKFGVNFKFNEKKPWVLGTYFSTEGTENPTAYDGTYFGRYGSGWRGLDLSSNRRIDLLYGRKFGTSIFGFGFNYISSGSKSDVAGNKWEDSYSRYGFNFGLTPDNGKWDVAAALSLGTWTNKDDSGDVLTEPDGYTDFSLRGRLFHKLNQNVVLIPHAEVAFGSHGQKAYFPFYYVNGDTTAYKTKQTTFGLGCGLNYTPVTNVLAVLDFGFSYNKLTTEDTHARYDGETWRDTTVTDKQTTVTLPYWKLGLEGDVFSWLDVRFGATSNWESFKWEKNYKYNYASNSTYLGLGFNFNRLHLDTQVNPELFLEGFNFISGNSNHMNYQIRALYEMF